LIRLRTFLPLVAFIAAACSLVPAELQRELLPSNTSYKTAEAAYQVLIERHVDKPTSQTLLGGALDGVVTEAKKEGASDGALPSAGLNLTGSTGRTSRSSRTGSMRSSRLRRMPTRRSSSAPQSTAWRNP